MMPLAIDIMKEYHPKWKQNPSMPDNHIRQLEETINEMVQSWNNFSIDDNGLANMLCVLFTSIWQMGFEQGKQVGSMPTFVVKEE